MPLPPDCTLPLFAQPSPSEMVSAKLRQAMVVRMSAETLDALELAAQNMDVEFSDNPGIYIGQSFFPMRSLKEDSPHELYLRLPSAARQMAPLRLYASVTGKFTIERELDERMKDRIREVTIDAAKQRDRKVKLIDNPPDLPKSNAKKRKDVPTMFRNAVRPSDQAKLMASVSSSSTPAPPNSSNKDDSLRKRLVHCLAVSERTQDHTVRMVGGPDCNSSLRRELLDLLERVAEPIPSSKKDDDPSLRLWRLKPASWLEVRPYEWPKLTESERVAMARTGRQKLDSLHVSQSNPAWKHVMYRSPSSNAPGAPSASSSLAGPTRNTASSTDEAKLGTSKSDVRKRGVSSKEMKEKKAKPRANSKAEIQMKDESFRTAPRTSSVNEQPSPSPPKPIVPLRKTPGSGFRIGKSTSQDTHSNTARESSSNVVPSRTKLADVREMRDTEPCPPHPKLPHRIPQSASPERKVVSVTPPQRIRKLRDTGDGTDSEKEKQALHANVLRKGTPRPREQGASENKHGEEVVPSTLKRKKAIIEDDDYEATSSRSTSQKKRKLENGLVFTPSTGEGSRVKDPSPPKKSELAPAFRPKSTRETSPLPQQPPLPKIKKDIPRTSTQGGKVSMPESTPSSPNQTRKRDDSKVAYKTRRRSPVYTSSEDERLVRSPKRAVSVGPLPTPPMTTHRASPSVPAAHSQTRSHSHTHESRPLPTDHANLRVRYSTSYLEYLSKFQTLVAQKGKIDSMLKSDIVSAGSITDSDGDIELMDPEELARLSSEYKVLEGELATIRNIFSPH